MVYISVFFCLVSRTLTISIFGESFDANWHRFGEYKKNNIPVSQPELKYTKA